MPLPRPRSHSKPFAAALGNSCAPFPAKEASQYAGGAAPRQGPSSSYCLAARQGRPPGELHWRRRAADRTSLRFGECRHGPEPGLGQSSLADGPGFHRPTSRSTARFGSSVRGSVGRAKLQAELLSGGGGFARQSASTWATCHATRPKVCCPAKPPRRSRKRM